MPSTFSHTSDIVSAYSTWLASLTMCIFSVDNHKLIIMTKTSSRSWSTPSRSTLHNGILSFSRQNNLSTTIGCMRIRTQEQTPRRSCDMQVLSMEQTSKVRTTPNLVALNETDLHPLYPPPPILHKEDGVDVDLNLNLQKNGTNFDFLINGIQNTSFSVPVLLQLLSGDITASDLAPNDCVYTLLRDKVLEPC
ncbi:hypothetical protein EV702DRAFT_703779 [Suillus placidus]|uniref:Uncharacterized protein n=1 Tax=Suillus placidus TaxID=48579 RepID=A0A9P7CXX0_9AGAM|nr:hypothetical protein EV702DRAFT_703779 [Suillus placidus]